MSTWDAELNFDMTKRKLAHARLNESAVSLIDQGQEY